MPKFGRLSRSEYIQSVNRALGHGKRVAELLRDLGEPEDGKEYDLFKLYSPPFHDRYYEYPDPATEADAYLERIRQRVLGRQKYGVAPHGAQSDHAGEAGSWGIVSGWRSDI
ncbi:MAG: hypothetical protein HWN51_06585 [Desulfobacterales bacterium]|nr:hypothetical protein [Desulfobacterales bacterium]